ncbi:MAG TPA: hypothetical protein VH309_14635 [Elusimicrobiota bacterium]|nr:hypothetical protein [Elusimicrobiota bacterium]
MPQETVPCPGCAKEMPVDEEICGACRRPRDEFEIEKGRDLLRARAEARRRRPFVIARRVLAVAAAVAIFQNRSFFFARTAALRAEVRRQMEEAGRLSAASATQVPAGSPETTIPPASGEDTAFPHAAFASNTHARADPAHSRTAPSHSAPPLANAPAIAVRPQDPPPGPRGVFRIYGVVYDMRSLRPVPSAVVAFSPGGYQVRTDQDGHYLIDFVGSFFDQSGDPTAQATVRAPGYLAGQVEDNPDASFLLQPLKDRLEFIAELSPGDLDDIPIRFDSDNQLVPLDLVLIPESARKEP